ncbi:MAG: hypothetical protein J0I32_05830 [Sphingobacteriales bacterium]|mgnify:FL=1|nr:hypothetical protein [Sphingobacteriales bacterium]OJW03911.1 MAG: hypothetical protein BGO52_17330 [Sphingobacteriales bacterium 44-61]
MSKQAIALVLIGGGLVAGYSYYVRMKKTSAELQVIPDASVYKVNWDGITIRIDVLLKNPTNGSFSIKFPFVKLMFKDTVIGSSEVVNNDIKIPAYGQVKISKLLVNIPMVSIFSVSTSILKAIQSKEQVKIVAAMITTIDLGMVKVPFEESHEIILKK